MVPNRVKFLLAGPVLETLNPLLPGRPHQRLAELVGPSPGRLLELCAGTGYVARLLARANRAGQAYALDLSPEMLAVGRRKAVREGLDRIEFVHADAAELPFDNESFDTVIAAYGLHELPTAIRARAAAEAARVLRPGGRFVIMDLDAPARRSHLFCAYMRLVEKPDARGVLGSGLVRLLSDSGFEIQSHVSAQARPIPFQLVDARTTS